MTNTAKFCVLLRRRSIEKARLIVRGGPGDIFLQIGETLGFLTLFSFVFIFHTA